MIRVLSLAALAALSAQAHPGHGPLDHGATHFVTSPWHMATGLAASLILLAVAQRMSSTRARVLARASALTLALWGLLA